MFPKLGQSVVHISNYLWIAALSEKDAGKELDWDTVGNICTKYLEDEVCKGQCL